MSLYRWQAYWLGSYVKDGKDSIGNKNIVAQASWVIYGCVQQFHSRPRYATLPSCVS